MYGFDGFITSKNYYLGFFGTWFGQKLKKLHLLEVFPFKFVVPSRQNTPVNDQPSFCSIPESKNQHTQPFPQKGENVGPLAHWPLFSVENLVIWPHVANDLIACTLQ